ncbi:MAG: PD-(D/E)XK nuclease family protein [Bacteroidia bacterium]
MDENNLLLDKVEIQNSIIKYKNDSDVQKLQSLYFTKSFSEILLVGRREISHSSFLAWLLDNNEMHSLSYLPIQKFLEIVLLRRNNKIELIYPTFFNSILIDNYTINSLKIEKEKDLGRFGRLDIFIEILMIIDNTEYLVKLIIENKVECKENNDQTQRYYEYFEAQRRKYETEINLYIYLSAIPTIELNQLTEVQCICKEFIQINYQYLVDYLLEPALNQDISERTNFIIKEYLKSLSQLSFNNENTKYKQSLIMALGKEEKELLSNFWNKNEKLIMSAMYANSINPDLDEETRDLNKKLLESYSEKSGIGIEVQKTFAELEQRGVLDDFINVLCDKNYSKKIFNIGYSLLIEKYFDKNCGLDSNDYPRYYKKKSYIINGKEYLLCNHWTVNNVDFFRRWANSFVMK